MCQLKPRQLGRGEAKALSARATSAAPISREPAMTGAVGQRSVAAASPIHDGKGTRILISLPKDVKPPEMLL